MELFIFRHTDYERIYNCTGINIDDIPLGERTRFVVESVVMLVLCTISYVLYIPCMFSLWKHINEGSCYLLLFYIGVMDIANLWMPGYLSPILSLQGAVFCSSRTLIYLAGRYLDFFWIAETTADLILGLNRCLDLLWPKFAKQLFSPKATGIWLFCCTVYALYYLFFVKPLAFNAAFFAWFFNPFEGYRADTEGEFDEPLHKMHDIAVAIVCPLLYTIFLVTFLTKTRKLHQTTGSQRQISKSEKMMFIQVFLISLMNALTGSLYMLFQYIQISQWLITLGEFAWFFVHGLPPFIYLALNQTMRRDCVRMFYKVFLPHRVTKLHGHTVVVAVKPATNNLVTITASNNWNANSVI